MSQYSDEIVKKVISEYKAGTTRKELSEKYTVRNETVKTWLKELGIEVRHESTPPNFRDWDKIKKDLESEGKK